MSAALDALIAELLEWIGDAARPYAEVVDAWRTSCPRLPVWEDANERGFLRHSRDAQGGALVSVSVAGREFIQKERSR
jgi:hypothetical protein